MSYVANAGFVDPFTSNKPLLSSFTNALLATAFFRCWHILFFFAAWSTTVCLVNHYAHRLVIQPTLLTVYAQSRYQFSTSIKFDLYNLVSVLFSVLSSRIGLPPALRDIMKEGDIGPKSSSIVETLPA
jgi:ion channel-forming bestrophin family protein